MADTRRVVKEFPDGRWSFVVTDGKLVFDVRVARREDGVLEYRNGFWHRWVGESGSGRGDVCEYVGGECELQGDAHDVAQLAFELCADPTADPNEQPERFWTALEGLRLGISLAMRDGAFDREPSS